MWESTALFALCSLSPSPLVHLHPDSDHHVGGGHGGLLLRVPQQGETLKKLRSRSKQQRSLVIKNFFLNLISSVDCCASDEQRYQHQSTRGGQWLQPGEEARHQQDSGKGDRRGFMFGVLAGGGWQTGDKKKYWKLYPALSALKFVLIWLKIIRVLHNVSTTQTLL